MPQAWSLTSWFRRAPQSRRSRSPRCRTRLFLELLERREVLSGGPLGQGLSGSGVVGNTDPALTRGPGQSLGQGGTDGSGGTGGTTDTFARYLAGLYRDLLHRWPAPSEISGWENAIGSGLDVGQVANIFTHSAEYAGIVIGESYASLLGRGVDPSGLASWTAFLQNGGTIEQFDAQILGSTEYFNLQGGSEGQWLDALYRDELNRPVDGGAQNYWLSQLQHGATHAGIAFSVVTSAEAQTQLVTGLYQQDFSRPGTDSEIGYWVGQLQSGMAEASLVTVLGSSPEYQQTHESDSTLDAPYPPLPSYLTGGPIVSVVTGNSSGGSGSGSGQTGGGGSGSGSGGSSGTGTPFQNPIKLKTLPSFLTTSPLDNAGYVGSQALVQLFNDFSQPTSPGSGGGAGKTGSGFTPSATQLLTFEFDPTYQSVLVNVRARPDSSAQQTSADIAQMKVDLQNLGMKNIQLTASQDMLTGYLPITAIDKLSGVTDFSAVTPVYAPIQNMGAVTTQGDHLTGADAFRASKGVDGTGVTVGILSDPINQIDSQVDGNPDVGIAESQRTGDLPAAGVQVLKDGPASATDEGRGMAEIIYDMAPGANLQFYSSDGGPQAMAQGIQALAQAGSQVVVDDTTYANEPFFNDGVLAQTVDQVAASRNLVYVTSAGNYGDNAWSASFKPTTATVGNQSGTFQNFGTSTSPSALQSFTLGQGQIINLSFQWDDAFLEGGSNSQQYQVQNTLAVYVTDPTGSKIYATFADDNRNTDEALQRVVFLNDGSYGSDQFALAFQLKSTAPGGTAPTQLKWVRFDNNAPAQGQGAPAIFGHAAALGALTVGAVPVNQPKVAESFSSQGPATILFDSHGFRQQQPDIRVNKPNLAAPDGVNTANFPGVAAGSPLAPGAFPVFYGTSAAAAHAAAAAALLRQANPGVPEAAITAGLQSSALHIGASGRDPSAGAGLLQLAPLPAAPAPAPKIAVDPNVDISKHTGDEWEEEIGINPTNPLQLAVESNSNFQSGQFGSFFANSNDGGLTWTGRLIGDGNDGLPLSFGDPSVTYDDFGNLFVSYIGSSNGSAIDQATLLVSTDNGTTFKVVGNFTCQDQPKVATGAGAVWEMWNNGDVEAAGAAVTGLGVVGAFGAVQAVPNSNGGNFGNFSVGPSGQVLISFENAGSGVGPDQIQVSLNPTGLGGTFNAPVIATATQVGSFRPITPQAVRTIDTDGRLFYDRSPGPHNGRVYLDYVDAANTTTDATNIFVRFSDDDGVTWSPPVKVNDDTGGASHFWPRLAVDQTTGNVAVSWLDCRNDPTDNEYESFCSVSFDGGLTFLPNVQVASGPSNAVTNQNNGNQTGDYSGIAFFNGIFYPCWPDNSTTLKGNPDLPHFDLATAAVRVSGKIGPQFGEDAYELNDNSNVPTNFGPLSGFKSIPNLTITIHENGIYDYDWYRFTAGKTGVFNATETTTKGGDLEVHLFTIRNNTLVELRRDDTAHTGTHNVNAPFAAGQVILVEVKGRNSLPGIKDQGAYQLDVSLV